MANKAENVTDVKSEEAKIDTAETVTENKIEMSADAAAGEFEFIDAYADRRNEAGEEEAYYVGGDEQIFVTIAPLSLLTSKNTNSGREYHNVATSWRHKYIFDGEEVVEPLTVEFTVTERRNGFVIKQLYDRIARIFAGRDSVPLEIVKNTRTDRNNKKVTTWTARCSRKSDDGIVYSVTLRPNNTSDEENFKILLAKLTQYDKRIGYVQS